MYHLPISYLWVLSVRRISAIHAKSVHHTRADSGLRLVDRWPRFTPFVSPCSHLTSLLSLCLPLGMTLILTHFSSFLSRDSLHKAIVGRSSKLAPDEVRPCTGAVRYPAWLVGLGVHLSAMLQSCLPCPQGPNTVLEQCGSKVRRTGSPALGAQ